MRILVQPSSQSPNEVACHCCSFFMGCSGGAGAGDGVGAGAGAGAGVGWLWLALVGSLVFYSFRVGFSHGSFLIVLIVKIVFLSGSCGGVHPGVGWLG